MKKCLLFLLCSVPFLVSGCKEEKKEEVLKPRIVVLTDIAPGNIEPDDMESMVRLMTYADQYEIEALITTIGWNCDPYPTSWADSLYRVLDAYEHDVANLMKRSEQKGFKELKDEEGRQELGYWPSPEYLRSRVAMGSQRAGIGVIGEDNHTEGSELIIRLVDEEDDRPLWITCWGGGNTLAQAIWKVSRERTPQELKAFLHKLRVYTITDQDMVYGMRMNRAYSSHQWMRKEFVDDLLFIWDESAWLSQNELGSKSWKEYAEKIQGWGELGKAYPTYKWGVEGDTPSFLHVMPNGLHDPDSPSQIGWAGCSRKGMCPDSITVAWTNWQQPQKGVSRSYEERFYPDTFNDFAARMAWAESGKGNRNPVVVMEGKKGYLPICVEAEAGGNVRLDASGSYDPDGDELTYLWWMQEDICTCQGDVELQGEGAKANLQIPAEASGGEIHVICEVRDNGTPALVAYQRVIVSVK